MSVLSECHRVLTNGVGKCSKTMWDACGGDAGFCDAPAYGEASEKARAEYRRNESFAPSALACPRHGGPPAPADVPPPRAEEPIVVCDACGGTEKECASFRARLEGDQLWEAGDKKASARAHDRARAAPHKRIESPLDLANAKIFELEKALKIALWERDRAIDRMKRIVPFSDDASRKAVNDMIAKGVLGDPTIDPLPNVLRGLLDDVDRLEAKIRGLVENGAEEERLP